MGQKGNNMFGEKSGKPEIRYDHYDDEEAVISKVQDIKDEFDKQNQTYAGQIFIKHVKGHNFVTSRFIRYYISKKYVIELTHGTAWSNDPIVGVTVIDRIKDERDHDHTRCFQGEKLEGVLKEAVAYIEELMENGK